MIMIIMSLCVTCKSTNNPLIAPWTGAYGGVPCFDAMDLTVLKEGIVIGIERHLNEIDAITRNPDMATFENTIIAMEQAGHDLQRVMCYYWIWNTNLSTPLFRDIQKEIIPLLSQYETNLLQNEALFARIKLIYHHQNKNLQPNQQRLLEFTYKKYIHNGITIDVFAKQAYAALSKRLAQLYATFSNNLMADEERYVTYLDKNQLGGLSPAFIASAKSAATEHDHDGQYAITNTRSSMAPFLTFSDERALRKKVWHNYYNRGDNGGKRDNNAIIKEILQLRHQRVQLLGYDNYATWQLENRMAKTPHRVMTLLETVWPSALARVDEEVAEMQAIADAMGAKIRIAPWDYRYYGEKVRKAKYDLDSEEVMQYLQLDKLREAMFFVASELFGYQFTPIPQGALPVYHEDVRVWEVTEKATRQHIGLWYLDPYARKGKRSGAWANTYRDHAMLNGVRTVLSSNNSNFIKPAEGEAVLISWDDATTFFHEFGHALHSLSSQTTYPSLNGALRDYVEFQSQLLERWLLTDKVTKTFLIHHQTSRPIPDPLLAKIKKAAKFNQGFATTEYLACALMDMKYHTTDPKNIDPDRFERIMLKKLNMPKEIVMRHRSTQFAHIFSSESYAAGYYGYLWADVLAADATEAFTESPEGFYDKTLCQKLVKHLFAAQNTITPEEAYRAFRGRDATVDALLRSRDFPVLKGN
jgi:peptidyl-dipeptidase Dcp